MQESSDIIVNSNVVLFDRNTNEAIYATIRKVDRKYLKILKWKFKWYRPIDNGYTVYGIFIGDEPQGLIALTENDSVEAVEVNLVESAPGNIGEKGRYDLVGECLFAIAAFISITAGYEGYVMFQAKTKLIYHYESKIGATWAGLNNMYLNDIAANHLVINYYVKEGEGDEA